MIFSAPGELSAPWPCWATCSQARGLPVSADRLRRLTRTNFHDPKYAKRRRATAVARVQSGCKPDTSAPALDASTPEDAAAQKESPCSPATFITALPAAYEKLAAFANKHAASVWGQRAALALGYDDYSKARFPQASAGLKRPRPIPCCASTRSSGPRKPIVPCSKNGEAAQEFAAFCRIILAQS